MKSSPRTAFRRLGRAAALVLGGFLSAHCSPDDTETGIENGANAGIEALQVQLEMTRKERDSLLEKLDESTRARVELDGEISRLRRELKELGAGPKAANPEPRPAEAR